MDRLCPVVSPDFYILKEEHHETERKPIESDSAFDPI
jgi:hypothetical protein